MSLNNFSKHISLIAFVLLSFVSYSQTDTNKLDENGKKNGLWRGLFEESQRIKYEGTFDHGKEAGVFTFYDDTKIHTVVATRDFSKGNNSAYTTFYDPKKNIVSEGNVVDKQYDGLWKYYHEASKNIMTSENYKNGKLNGKRTTFYPNGKVAEEENYVNGIRQGSYKKYTADKSVVLEEVNYVNGEVDGTAIYRGGDGNIVSKGPYVNGLKKGIWEFYENGKLKKKQKYPLRQKFAKLPPKSAN